MPKQLFIIYSSRRNFKATTVKIHRLGKEIVEWEETMTKKKMITRQIR